MAVVGFISLSRSATPRRYPGLSGGLTTTPDPFRPLRVQLYFLIKRETETETERSHKRSFKLITPLGTYTILDTLITGDKLYKGIARWVVNPALYLVIQSFMKQNLE